jgi:branched-chain amino acid transport system ATP-binding protein
LLSVDRVSSSYGPVQVLRDVSLHVDEGEAVTLLGPNGAGKSTLLRCISALTKPRRGSITYRGRGLHHVGPDAVVRAGIVQVPEGRRIFAQMTVLENLMLGAYTRDDGREVKSDLDAVYALFPDLAEKRDQLGGELSGGQQQMLAIGRALMARPTLLLLDEPSLGLSPIMVDALANTITRVREQMGMSILLVEQNAGLALEIASRVYVMQTGRIALSGTTAEVSPDEIRMAYLGQGAFAAPATR